GCGFQWGATAFADDGTTGFNSLDKLHDLAILTYIDASGKISMYIDIRVDGMSRIQLALNVSDLEQAIGFYSKLFGAEPAKRRPGYANFAIAEPPLKLVLIEGE